MKDRVSPHRSLKTANLLFYCAVCSPSQSAFLGRDDHDNLRSQHQGATGTESAARVRIAVARQAKDNKSWLSNVKSVPYELWTEPSAYKQVGALRDANMREKPLTRSGGSTRECGGYLSYIVENYDRLPDVSILLQAAPLQGEDYHSDSHTFSSIQRMAEGKNQVEFCSFNKFYTNWSSVPLLQKWSKALDAGEAKSPGRFSSLRHNLLPLLPAHGALQCYQSAQFAVSRARIQAHPLGVYQELLDFVRDGPITSGTHDEGSNRNKECGLMEVTWHLLFGEPAVCSRSSNSCRIAVEGNTMDCTLWESTKHYIFGNPQLCPKPSDAALSVIDRGM